jgi:histidyl-tRNA synthetase
MPEFKTLRGMRDLLPEDAKMMIHVEDQARKTARLYGYKEIITPVVESYDLLAAKAGDEVRSRMFAFKDLGGRDVALRPEFTASIARLVATTMRNEPKPFRLFCMGTVYRYDEPQRGRYREIWQSDYELIGSSRPEADAEVIMLTDGLMREAGLKRVDVKVGHIGVLRGILGQERVGEREQSAIMQLMDKKEYDNALKLVESAGASRKCLEVLHQLVECRGTNVTEVLNKTEELVRGYEKSVIAVENLRETLKLVSESGCKINVTVDAGFARGLEYYTGTIFEFYVPSIDVAVGGGGRYDKLVELFGGEPTPAVGIAHGIDRIVLALKMQKTVLRKGDEKTVVVVSINEELRGEALKISRMLRDAGVLVEVEVMGRRMAKALEDADRRKMDYAVIVGEREHSEGAVVVRDLAKREQSTVKVERLIDLING